MAMKNSRNNARWKKATSRSIIWLQIRIESSRVISNRLIVKLLMLIFWMLVIVNNSYLKVVLIRVIMISYRSNSINRIKLLKLSLKLLTKINCWLLVKLIVRTSSSKKTRFKKKLIDVRFGSNRINRIIRGSRNRAESRLKD